MTTAVRERPRSSSNQPHLRVFDARHPGSPAETRAIGPALPSTRALLIAGGDERIALDPATGRNPYGIAPTPEPGVLAFSSCTASPISQAAYTAADQMRRRLVHLAGSEPAALTYERERQRLIKAILHCCKLDSRRDLRSVLAASGTDLHRLAAGMLWRPEQAAVAITVDPTETGSGVPAALTLGGGLQTVALRRPDTTPRATAEVDQDFADQVDAAIKRQRRVLLVLTDVSKTGLIAPSPACALALQQRWPGQLQVLVDACQFRLSHTNLNRYLDLGFMLALTGSKFLGGPSFSGLLLIPGSIPTHPRNPRRLEASNFGLLLRWQAALAELRLFSDLPAQQLQSLTQDFARAMEQRLSEDGSFAAVATPRPSRTQPGEAMPQPAWDTERTIFSLIPRLACGHLANAAQVKSLHRQLLAQGVFLGQAVSVGQDGDGPIAALRLCLGARSLVEAANRGADPLIQQGHLVLDRLAALL